MEAKKHAETLTDEHDPGDQSNDETGTGRSYECTFCKRGFTNAQALGGHMNIHRRDRAKAAKHPSASTRSEEDTHPKRLSLISSETPRHYKQRSYPLYLPSNPRNPHVHHENALEKNSSLPFPYGGDSGTNLSLWVGSANTEDSQSEKKEERQEDGVDLELRLGHDP